MKREKAILMYHPLHGYHSYWRWRCGELSSSECRRVTWFERLLLFLGLKSA